MGSFFRETDSILIVAAHPDDEALGCAGTIAKATSAGAKVHALFFTDRIDF
jgi:LmbE family N-acetylglucosaminyl deacetylase